MMDHGAVGSPFSTPQQREEERAAKRRALLVAAVRAFNERGFQATSLDDVAASLGVTKPVIYHYLGNKDQVLFECLRIGLGQLREVAELARLEEGTGLDRLRRFLRRYAEIMMEDFGRCVVRAGDQSLAPHTRAQFRALKREIDETLRDLVAAAGRDGSARVDDVRLTSFALAGALNWPAHWHRENGTLTRAEIARRLVDIVCAGLAPGAGAVLGSD